LLFFYNSLLPFLRLECWLKTGTFEVAAALKEGLLYVWKLLLKLLFKLPAAADAVLSCWCV
jgi:hypothetical protein